MNLPEPYRIRSVERIHLLPRKARIQALERAGYNPFRLASREVFIDLLTDSGTGAMSDQQWASIHCADESYAGSASYERFAAAVQRVTGYPEVIPTHQGRACERVMMDVFLRPGDLVVSNALFDTTRANVERSGARGLDLPDPAVSKRGDASLFKGGIDLDRLADVLAREPVRLVILTCTSNSTGGHPVPMENARAASELCRTHGVPLFIDGARFAENAALLIRRDPSLEGRTVETLSRELFSYADGCLVSAKKNGLAHIGGFIALRDPALAQKLRENLIVTEGFETYGGLAGRDLDAIAVGLIEAMDGELVGHRVAQSEALHAALRARNVPVMSPAGGHAVYVDGAALFPHIPPEQFPGHAVTCALYAEAGVRTCEIGSLMFPGRPAGAPELTRLAIPWRTYTAAHLEYVAEALGRVAQNASSVKGLRIVSEPPALRHFRAVLAPL